MNAICLCIIGSVFYQLSFHIIAIYAFPIIGLVIYRPDCSGGLPCLRRVGTPPLENAAETLLCKIVRGFFLHFLNVFTI